ncbi:Tubulin-folding cofactor C, partial [Lachnellula subtilissima]
LFLVSASLFRSSRGSNSCYLIKMEADIPEFDRTGSQSDLKDRFYRYFQEACTELQEKMAQLESLSLVGGERKDAVDHLLAEISRLTNEVADLTGSVPAYDQRIYSQAIKALQEKLQETRARLEPKPRFQFKTTHKNKSAISIKDAAELAAQKDIEPPGDKLGLGSSDESSLATTPTNLITPPSEVDSKDTIGDLPSFPKNYNEEIMKLGGGPVRKPSFSQATNVNISNHTGLHIILPSSASHATSSGSLTKLNRCIVDMSVPTANGAPFAGLALKNIKHSLIIAGQVAGAAHITGVEDSIIVVASRQVRMHDCKNVDIYLHCASRPIIEDCSNVRFSPIPECHKVIGAEPVVNQWDQVDDFKWLKAEHSPNWSILPEDQRLKEDVWVTVVPGGPGVGLDDILKKTGLTGR